MNKAKTIRLPVALLEKLKKEAKKKGLTLNAYIIGILDKSA